MTPDFRGIDEIVQAVRAGGGRIDSEEDLRLSLSRSTYEVAKISENMYGLVEFYAHIKRERGKKKKVGVSESQDAELEHEEPDKDTQDTEVISNKEDSE